MQSAPFVQCDAPHVVVDTVKTAENGDGFIVRLYEAHGQHGHATLSFAQPLAAAETCNLLEERSAEATWSGATVQLAFGPFEIKTLRLRFGR
jgi:alpha-mannosidase